MDFKDELLNLIKNSNQLVKRSRLTDEQLDNIRLNFPNIPVDYIDYLRIVGAGDLSMSTIKIYQALCDLSDFGLEEVYSVDDGIMFFGDNYSGDFFGFDLSNTEDEVIEFWHDSETVHRTGKSFREFVSSHIQS